MLCGVSEPTAAEPAPDTEPHEGGEGKAAGGADGKRQHRGLHRKGPKREHQHHLAELKRPKVGDIVMVVATLVGFWMLAGQFASLAGMSDELKGATWSLIILAMVLAPTGHITSAIGLRSAAAVDIPLKPLTLVSIANSFTGLVAGTVGITATNIRFFQKRGLEPSTALVAGVFNSLAGGFVQTIIIIAALPAVISHIKVDHAGGGDTNFGLILVAIIGIGLIAGVIALVPRFRHFVVSKVRPQVDSARDDVRRLWHRPKNLLVTISANAASQLISTFCLWLCLEAFDTRVPLPTLLLLITAGALIGGLAPVPGGMGVIEATLIAGLTSVGVDATVATSAVLSYRLVTSYLPPAWGWPTLVWLRHHDYL